MKLITTHKLIEKSKMKKKKRLKIKMMLLKKFSKNRVLKKIEKRMKLKKNRYLIKKGNGKFNRESQKKPNSRKQNNQNLNLQMVMT